MIVSRLRGLSGNLEVVQNDVHYRKIELRFIPDKHIGLTLATADVQLRRKTVKKLMCFPFFLSGLPEH